MPIDMSFLYGCCRVFLRPFAGGKPVPLFFCVSALFHILLTGLSRMSNTVVFLVLPLLWSMASHLYCWLSVLIHAAHHVLHLTIRVLTCILGCLCMLILH